MALAYSNKSLQEKLDFYEKSFLNVDNWAIIDGVSSSLKFNENDYLVLKNYVKKNYHSQSEFLSRSCYTFLNACSWKEKYIEEILKFIYEDAKYYVLMAEAWLLSNLYLKDHKRIIAFLETLDDSKNLKKFTLRKIYDSLQVSNKEKQSLKKYFKKDKC